MARENIRVTYMFHYNSSYVIVKKNGHGMVPHPSGQYLATFALHLAGRSVQNAKQISRFDFVTPDQLLKPTADAV